MSINVQNLSFTYFGSTGPALHDLTVAVAPGEVWGVLGRSGAGKSTLALLLSGFMPQFFNGEAAGSARIGQYDLLLLSPGELSGTVALVLSDPFGQISGTRFTVFEEVAFGLENLGLPPSDIRERCQWALDTVGIAALADRSPYSLSGGQQQRLVLAAALAMRPQVLILDQPAAQLDPRTVLELGDTLRSLAAGGTTIVVAEARVPWLARLADRVLLLHEGSARLHGPAEAVLHDPLLGELGITPSGAQETLGLAGLPAATAQEAQPLIALEGVGFRYEGGVEALREVSLTIRRGERVALLGRNGAGKSTLLRHLNGLLRPTAGRVLVAGNDTRQRTVAQCARTAALSFQDVRNQLFAGSVREELAFGPRNLGYEPARVAALVAQALATTGLESVAGEHPYDLSPQQRRLVAIGATLAMDTPLLVLDEPGAGMDDAGLLLLEQIIARRASEGASVLVVSHDVRFSARVSERVLLLAEGRLAVDSPWHDLDDAERALLDAEVGLPVAHNA